MDEKELYFELLNEMENIVNKHKKTQNEWQDFDPTKSNPVESPKNISNPEQFTPFGSLKSSIDNLCRKAGVYKE